MQIPLQIRFSDVDRLGHINNSVYAQFFDIGRLSYLEKHLPELNFNDRTLVLVRIETDFLRSGLYGEELYVESKITRIGNKSLSMEQTVASTNGEIKCRSTSVLSTFDPQTATSFPMPEEWRRKLTTY